MLSAAFSSSKSEVIPPTKNDGATPVPSLADLRVALDLGRNIEEDAKQAKAIRASISLLFQAPWKNAYAAAENLCLRQIMRTLVDAMAENDFALESNAAIEEARSLMIRLATLDNNPNPKGEVAGAMKKVMLHMQ